VVRAVEEVVKPPWWPKDEIEALFLLDDYERAVESGAIRRELLKRHLLLVWLRIGPLFIIHLVAQWMNMSRVVVILPFFGMAYLVSPLSNFMEFVFNRAATETSAKLKVPVLPGDILELAREYPNLWANEIVRHIRALV